MSYRLTLLLFIIISISGAAQKLPHLIPFRDGNKWGLVDTTKQIIVSCQYDAMNICDSSFFCFSLNGKKGVINDSGRVILPAEYDDVTFQKQWILIYRDNSFGLADRNGKIIIPNRYKYIRLSNYSDYRAFVKTDHIEGLISLPSGKEIIPCAYGRIDDYTKTWFVSIYDKKGRNELKGAYNNRGKLIVPVKYEYLQFGYLDYRNGTYDSSLLVAADKIGDEYVYDTSGTLLFSKKGARFQARRGSLFIVYEDQRVCIETADGKIVLPAKHEEIEMYDYTTSDYATVYNRKTGKCGIIALNGRRVTPTIYDGARIEYFADGVPRFIVAEKMDEWLVDSLGNKLLYLGMDSTGETGVFEKFVIYRKNGLLGCTSYSGSEIVPFQYEHLAYNERTAQFIYSENGKWGLMDSTGAKLFREKYNYIFPVDGKHALVNDGVNNKMNTNDIIAMDGHLIFQPGTFDSIVDNLHSGRDYQVVNYKHGHGVISTEGRLIVKDTFDLIAPASFGYFGVKKGMFVCIDSLGNVTSHYLNIAYPNASGYIPYPTFLPEPAGTFIAELYYVSSRNGYGLVNKQGREIVPPVYTAALSEYSYNIYSSYTGYYNGRIVAKGDSELFLLNKNNTIDVYLYSGKKLNGISGKAYYLKKLDPRMDLFIFGDKGTSYVNGGLRRFGLMDSTGKIVLRKYYHTIRVCTTDSNLIIASDSAGKVHYYDRKGNETGPPEYEEVAAAQLISGGRMVRVKNRRYGLIDNRGNVLIPFEYESLTEINEGIFLFRVNGQYGLIDGKGNMLVPLSYNWIVPTTKPGLFYTEHGYIDIHGTEYWK